MTRKADFNAEEWSMLVGGPMYAALRVISADRGGTLRESLALGRAYEQARAAHGQSEFLDELVASPPSIDPNQLREAGDRVGQVVSDRRPRAPSWKPRLAFPTLDPAGRSDLCVAGLLTRVRPSYCIGRCTRPRTP